MFVEPHLSSFLVISSCALSSTTADSLVAFAFWAADAAAATASSVLAGGKAELALPEASNEVPTPPGKRATQYKMLKGGDSN